MRFIHCLMIGLPLTKGIRFAFIGDWGQPGVGLDMVGSEIRNRAYDFLVMGGDNFYETGVINVMDSQFETTYGAQFGGLNSSHYVVLGNHDYYGNPLAQLLYSQYDPHWVADYYYFSRILNFGDVSVCALFIDTMDFVQSGQVAFLHATLQSPKCRQSDWIYVFGHHPIFSSGWHGDSANLQSVLKPILDMYSVDFYVAGHDHLFSCHIDTGLNYIVSGAGSLRTTSGFYTSTSRAEQTRFHAMSIYGFAEFNVNKTATTLSIINAETKEQVYTTTTESRLSQRSEPVNYAYTITGHTPWSGGYIGLVIFGVLLTWIGGFFLIKPHEILSLFK